MNKNKKTLMHRIDSCANLPTPSLVVTPNLTSRRRVSSRSKNNAT